MSNNVYATRQDAKADGMFSRRHETRAAHDESEMAYHLAHQGPIADWERELLSGEPVDHSPAAQLARLDARLGKNVGAAKERAKLARS